MDEFKNSATGNMVLMAHPVPWRYVSNWEGDSRAAIIDADDKVVVKETHVSPVVFDLIWAAYFDLLRE